MAMYELDRVFVTVGLPTVTFVKRAGLERAMQAWKNSKTKHLLIFSPSKSGKTSLWKKHIPGQDAIKIPCKSGKTVQEVYREILDLLNSFYESETKQVQETKSSLIAELKTLLGIGNARIQAQREESRKNEHTQVRIAEPNIGVNLIKKFLKPSGKIVILEDFHYADDDFKRSLAEDLKAFSDDNCPWILVGVPQHRVSDLLEYNIDLQHRMTEIPVEWFTEQELQQIIQLGQFALNIELSSEIERSIIAESLGSAAIVQNICEMLCLVNGVEKTSKEKKLITDELQLKKVCEEIARSNEGFYQRLVKAIAQGGRGVGNTDKYKWFLKLIKEKDVPKQGLTNIEICREIKNLGNSSISLQSVTTGLAYLPQLLQKNKLPAVFDYDEERKTFYLLDKYVKFALKWMPELVDSLFPENQDNS